MAAKMMGKVASRICKYSGGPKFCGNHSMSHCFRDKCALRRNSRSRWQESNFWQKSFEIPHFKKQDGVSLSVMKSFYISLIIIGPRGLAYEAKFFCRNLCISHHFQDTCIFCILHKNSRWPPKWRESNFWETLPVDPAVTMRVKNFVEIVPSHTISKINAFYVLPFCIGSLRKVNHFQIFT